MAEGPEVSVSELMDSLSQANRPLGLLIGAGCPFGTKDEAGSPLVPDLPGLTAAVGKKLNGTSANSALQRIVSQLKREGIENPTVEDILNRVRASRELVASDPVHGLTLNDLTDVERSICEAITTLVTRDLPGNARGYRSLAAWVGSVPRSEAVELFTTNYDSLLEQALESQRVPYFDGFVGANRPFFDAFAVETDQLPARWARVWKLHGSIDWKSEGTGSEFRVWRGAGGNTVIYPSHMKYEQSRKMPYLALLDRLRQFVSKPSSVLITVGYSFRDDHINDVLVQALQGSPTSVVFGLCYGQLSDYEVAVNLARSRANLRVHASDGAVIGTDQFEWSDRPREPNVPSSPEAVEWTKVSEDPEKWRAKFLLGDFGQLGLFLASIQRRGARVSADA